MFRQLIHHKVTREREKDSLGLCVCVCVNAVTHNTYSMRSLKVKKLIFGCTMIGIVKEYLFFKKR